MSKHLSIRCLAAVFVALCTLSAVAQDTDPERSIETERDDVAYTINPDGSYAEQHDWAIKVLKDTALEYAKQTSVSYSTSIQKADVLEAYTRKPDGRRIDVPKSNFQVQTNGGKDDGGPVFSDYTTLSVVFPELAVGDTVVFSYKLTASQPMFDGQFSMVDGFSPNRYYGSARISIDAPASLSARYQAWGLKEIRNETRGDRKLLEWSYSNTSPKRDKRSAAAVFDLDKSIGLAYSTFASYSEIAAAYGKRALPKAAVTPRIRKLADEVTAGKQQPRDRAKALYEWVSTNITYGGNCIGLGAVVPHDIDFILDNRMGDCKDHATLLQALLAAKGIASDQALINASSVFRLPKVPVASMVNHVFNYVPSLDLYMDATAKGIPFGTLPMQDVGKPILLVSGDRPDARTPAWPLGSNRQRMRTVVKIAADGSASGKMDVETTGIYALQMRGVFRDVTDTQSKDMVKDIYRQMGLVGSGTVVRDDPKPMLGEFNYSIAFDVEGLYQMPGAFPVAPLLFNVAPVARYVAGAADDVDEQNDITCISGHSEEEYVFEFPAETKVVAVPPDVQLGDGVLAYTATHSLKDNVLTVKRVFDDRTPGPTCTPSFNASYKAFTEKVLRNLKAQTVYQ